MPSVAAQHLLPHRIAVLRRSLSPGSSSVIEASWLPHLNSVPARVDPTPRRRRLDDRVPLVLRRFKIYIDRTVDIQTSDRITHQGALLRVVDAHDYGPGAAWRVLLTEEVNP